MNINTIDSYLYYSAIDWLCFKKTDFINHTGKLPARIYVSKRIYDEMLYHCSYAIGIIHDTAIGEYTLFGIPVYVDYNMPETMVYCAGEIHEIPVRTSNTINEVI